MKHFWEGVRDVIIVGVVIVMFLIGVYNLGRTKEHRVLSEFYDSISIQLDTVQSISDQLEQRLAWLSAIPNCTLTWKHTTADSTGTIKIYVCRPRSILDER